MKKSRFTTLLSSIALLCQFSFGQLATIDVDMDTNVIELGRQVKLTYAVEHKPGNQIELPVYGDTLVEGIELLLPPKIDSIVLKNGNSKIQQELLVTGFEPGKYYISPRPFVIHTQFGVDTIFSKPTYINILGVQLDSTGLRDIKEVFHVKRTMRDFMWLWFLLLAIVLGLVFYFILLPRITRRKGVFEKEEEREPAHIIALRELDKLKAQKLWQQEQVKEYYSKLTAIIRKYLENQFTIQAMEETTHEILRDIRLRGLDGKLKMNDLEALLNLADQIKFAKGKADPEQNMQHLENAFTLVKQTIGISHNANTSVKVDENDEFMKFAFGAIDHSIDSIQLGTVKLVPYVMTLNRSEQKLQRFASENNQESIKLATHYLNKLQPKPDYAVLSYDGYVTIEGRNHEALFVKAYDKKEQKGLVFAQRYQPKTDELEFQLIGTPALIGKEENCLRQINLKK